jgi:hypothetical protein
VPDDYQEPREALCAKDPVVREVLKGEDPEAREKAVDALRGAETQLTEAARDEGVIREGRAPVEDLADAGRHDLANLVSRTAPRLPTPATPEALDE